MSDALTLALALSPGGLFRVVVAAPDEDSPALAPAVVTRVREAFARGAAAGLLHLGVAEISTVLAPSLAFGRRLATTFVSRVRALEDPRAMPPFTSDELDALRDEAPPFIGAEYLSRDVLAATLESISQAFFLAVSQSKSSAHDWLRTQDLAWHAVGRVCFHLAENKRDPDAPFAFLATYATRLAAGARVQHRPLGDALREYAGARNKSALLALLEPVRTAAAKSELVRTLADSGALYEPHAWTTSEAWRFLKDVPAMEEAGIVVRVPDWWHARKASQPVVQVNVGRTKPSGLGADALLDFSVAVALDGDALSQTEIDAMLAAGTGLVRVRGRWVAIDREQLAEVLGHWRAVEKRVGKDGLSLLEGMRLLAGVPGENERATVPETTVRAWSDTVAGPWLAEQLAQLREPSRSASADPGEALHATLRPYQREGVQWLWTLSRLGLGGCLADDMGLGKTVQVIALLLLLREHGPRGASLLVVPASLVGNWTRELDRFAPSLRYRIEHRALATKRERADETPADIAITTYGTLARSEALRGRDWNVVVLDEAQAIKNPNAQQTRAVKSVSGRLRFVLTGTPVENHLGDLWSLFDFTSPGLLGDAKSFRRATRAMADAPGGYAPLRTLVRPYILRRLKTDPHVISDLPAKTEVKAYCHLTKTQIALYQQSVDEMARALRRSDDDIARKGLVLAFITRFKQICNHPSQWLGDEKWSAEDSGKFVRLAELCEPIRERQERVLVFTQFREMTGPLSDHLANVFGRPGLVLHGGTAVAQRRKLVDRFQGDDGPPFFVLSLKAGGTGLNLTAAAHVVHFDRWWNPAVEAQATDRAFRIGQKRNVLVHPFVCSGTVEEKIDAVIEEKKALAGEILDGTDPVKLTELSDEALIAMVTLDLARATSER